MDGRATPADQEGHMGVGVNIINSPVATVTTNAVEASNKGAPIEIRCPICGAPQNKEGKPKKGGYKTVKVLQNYKFRKHRDN